MKIALDTNVLISALVFGGKPRTIFELIVIDKIIIGVISKALLDELLGVLKIKFKYSQNQLSKIEKLIEENFIITSPPKIPKIIKEDFFDNQVLAVADSYSVNYIISGDNHLLDIRAYKNVPIIPPHFFIDKIFPK